MSSPIGTAKSFEFAAPQRIIFGEGAAGKTGELVKDWGRQALVVAGASEVVIAPVLISLKDAGLSYETIRVRYEPTLASVEAALEQARRIDADMVLGVGGGSAMDTAKAVAALLANPGELLDYLEVVGRGQKLRVASKPCACIPTTSGTGSEATRNAVVGVPEKQVKVSLRGAGMLPLLALVDPELTYSLPAQATAFTGLDALTQVIEPFVSIAANPLTDAHLPGSNAAGRSGAEACLSGWDGSPGAGSDEFHQPGGRAGTGKRQTGSGARLCRRAGRDDRRAAWGNLRPAAAAGDGGQYPDAAGARARLAGAGEICRSRPPADRESECQSRGWGGVGSKVGGGPAHTAVGRV